MKVPVLKLLLNVLGFMKNLVALENHISPPHLLNTSHLHRALRDELWVSSCLRSLLQNFFLWNPYFLTFFSH